MPAWATLPNALTLLRILLVPGIVASILSGQHALALVLFFSAAITDCLDGMLARRLNQLSRFGARLDPIADKLLMGATFLALAWTGAVPWWLVAVVFGRDAGILLGAVLLMRVTPVRDFPPSFWGKASTFTQIATVVCWMVQNAYSTALTYGVAAFMLWPCAVMTLWSGVHYAWRAMKLARRN
jgi:cardiolipin synthase (CMP-forming)